MAVYQPCETQNSRKLPLYTLRRARGSFLRPRNERPADKGAPEKASPACRLRSAAAASMNGGMDGAGRSVLK
jgi:hypothetical protein